MDVFSDVESELDAIRSSAAMIDMSPLSKYRISGPESVAYLNNLITRDVTKYETNQVIYALWCNEDGKLVGDGVVCRIDTDSFILSGDPAQRWLTQNAEAFDVQIDDLTHDVGLLAVQGPKSREVLETATGQDWSDFAFSRRALARCDNRDFEVWRQGFTGELGYELWVGSEDAPRIWDIFMDATESTGGKPAGFLAADLARIEAGLLIIGPDYTGADLGTVGGAASPVSPDHVASPIALGMESFVDLSKPDFVGKEALQADKAKGGPDVTLVGLELDWKTLVERSVQAASLYDIAPHPQWTPLPLSQGSQTVGRATSLTWSPTVRKMIGFGHIDNTLINPEEPLSVQWPVGGESVTIDAAITELPAFERRRR